MAKQLPAHASEDLPQPYLVANDIVEDENLSQVDTAPAATNHVHESNQHQAKPAAEGTSTADATNNGSFVMPAKVKCIINIPYWITTAWFSQHIFSTIIII